MVGPLTMKFGTLMYHDESSSKHKLQVCKQAQAINGVCASNLLMGWSTNNETWYTHVPL